MRNEKSHHYRATALKRAQAAFRNDISDQFCGGLPNGVHLSEDDTSREYAYENAHNGSCKLALHLGRHFLL